MNQALCSREPDGRSQQHTILDVPALLVDAALRESLLPLVTDPVVTAWWRRYFDRMDRHLQTEVINPIQTKVQRYAGSHAARSIVGQPRSTIDPLSWLRSGAIVIVNTGKGTVGEDTAALLGACLLNLVALGISEQARLDPRERRATTLIVDEFHTMPGCDYESILAELAKYGANLVLATQSLARLEALDQEQNRALRAMVFANLDGLFAFHTSAEDARYLVHELGGEVDETDLVGLGEHQCYVKLSVAGERMPTFSVRLDPPPHGNPDLAQALAASSASRFGRDRTAVERDIASALARLDRQRPLQDENSAAMGPRKARGRGAGGDPTAGPSKSRVRSRGKSRHVESAHEQLPLLEGERGGDDEASHKQSREWPEEESA